LHFAPFFRILTYFTVAYTAVSEILKFGISVAPSQSWAKSMISMDAQQIRNKKAI
jgi:hypothetical protein